MLSSSKKEPLRMNTSHCSAFSWLQALLEVVNDLFEEQTDLEKIVRKIMQRALTLLQCERCSVLLLEDIDSPVRPWALCQLLSCSCLTDPFASTFPSDCTVFLLQSSCCKVLLLPVVMINASFIGCEVLKDV